MQKIVTLLFALNSFFIALGQNDIPNQFSMLLGANYNLSNTNFNSTTGIGIFVEPNLLINNKFRLGYRFEPTALAYGVGVCDAACKEGANYVLNNYLKAEYLIGQPKRGKKGGRYQGYFGLSFNVLTHKRWITNSSDSGESNIIHNWVTDPGFGFRIGTLLGKIDISASYNIIGNDFQNYAGISVGYSILKR